MPCALNIIVYEKSNKYLNTFSNQKSFLSPIARLLPSFCLILVKIIFMICQKKVFFIDDFKYKTDAYYDLPMQN